MKLNKTHIKILMQLSKRPYESVVGLSEDLNIIPSTVDMSLKTILDMGLVEMSRNGKSVNVNLSVNKHAQIFKKVATLSPHMGFEDILSGNNLQIIVNLLKDGATIKILAEKLGVSTRTVIRSLRSLQNYGIVRKEGDSYLLNDQHEILYEFVRELQSYLNMKMARSFYSSAAVIWESLEEFILETPRPIDMDGFLPTCYQILEKYGIPLLMDNRFHYFCSPYTMKLRLEDACLHVLIVNPSSIRANLYVLLVILKNNRVWDWKYFERKSRAYLLEKKAVSLRRYIEGEGKEMPEFFPSWNELIEKAGDYDIDVQRKI